MTVPPSAIACCCSAELIFCVDRPEHSDGQALTYRAAMAAHQHDGVAAERFRERITLRTVADQHVSDAEALADLEHRARRPRKLAMGYSGRSGTDDAVNGITDGEWL